MLDYTCILLAAGEGQRAALGYNKVLYKIHGKKEIVLYSIEYFMTDPYCKRVVLVVNKRDENYFKQIIKSLKSDKLVYVLGGATRGDSVHSGLSLVETKYVIIHDSARPLIYKEDVYNLLNPVEETGGASLATKVYNTTCHLENGFVDEYFSRHTLASLITPQCFDREKLEEAYQKAKLDNDSQFTDDSGIFKHYGGQVKLVFTDNISVKATTSYDIKLLEVLLYANR